MIVTPNLYRRFFFFFVHSIFDRISVNVSMGVVCGTHIFLFPLNKGNINFLTIFFATWFQWNDTLCGFWKINSVQFVWFGMLKGQKRNDISLYCWFSKENYCYPLFLSFTCLTHLSMNNFFLRNENRIFNRMPHKWFSLNGCRNNDELPNRTKIDSKVTSFTSFIAINQKEKCNNILYWQRSVWVFQEKGNLPGNDVFTFCRSKKKKIQFHLSFYSHISEKERKQKFHECNVYLCRYAVIHMCCLWMACCAKAAASLTQIILSLTLTLSL